jgi:hypothetical protein
MLAHGLKGNEAQLTWRGFCQHLGITSLASLSSRVSSVGKINT